MRGGVGGLHLPVPPAPVFLIHTLCVNFPAPIVPMLVGCLQRLPPPLSPHVCVDTLAPQLRRCASLAHAPCLRGEYAPRAPFSAPHRRPSAAPAAASRAGVERR